MNLTTSRKDRRDLPNLPTPPNAAEKICYYGPQHRWFITIRSLAGVCVAISLLLFADSTSDLWLFWISLTIFTFQLGLSHYTTTRRRVRSLSDHRRIVSNWAPDVYPSADIFLPSCGEDLEVLVNTYSAVAALQYPGEVNVYVLDDSAREAVREQSEKFGFRYHVRPNRGVLKKAGNLKYGFDHSNGDFIVIFDADFAPRDDFLAELLPYFEMRHVGIVQSPQYFDSHRAMSWLQRSAGQVQESFYRWAQPSRDALGAPICVGTCAIYRRAALNLSGGFAQIGHSEDVHTGVNMMKIGFRTLYVPIVVAKGLCPDKLSSFISQQYRWCAGSMSLLVDKNFHAANLSFRQRLCFFTGFGYYLSTAAGVFLLSLPTLFMLWVYPERIHLSNFFWMLPTVLLYPFIRRMHTSGWSAAVLRSTMIASFAHALAIWHVVRDRPAEWAPTGTVRKTSMTSKVTCLIVGWEVATNLIQVVGIEHFLLDGRSIVDLAPIMTITVLNMTVWVPIVKLIWDERRRPTTGRRTPAGSMSAAIATG